MRSNGGTDLATVEPYRTAAMTMHREMGAATGADATEGYLRKMLVHHRGAIALSDVAIAQGSDPIVRAAAHKTKADQAREVAMIEAMLTGKPMVSASMPPEQRPSPRATPAQ